MIQICVYCKKKYGEKEPYDDKRITHGACPECGKKAKDELEKKGGIKK